MAINISIENPQFDHLFDHLLEKKRLLISPAGAITLLDAYRAVGLRVYRRSQAQELPHIGRYCVTQPVTAILLGRYASR
jgi:hypothetical protein